MFIYGHNVVLLFFYIFQNSLSNAFESPHCHSTLCIFLVFYVLTSPIIYIRTLLMLLFFTFSKLLDLCFGCLHCCCTSCRFSVMLSMTILLNSIMICSFKNSLSSSSLPLFYVCKDYTFVLLHNEVSRI